MMNQMPETRGEVHANREGGVSRCTSCGARIEGVKVCTPDAGVLCVECAKRSHAIPAPAWQIVRVGSK